MIQNVTAPISVALIFDHTKRSVRPWKVKWDGHSYTISSIGLHHTYRHGRTLFHVFCAESNELYFKLELNTDTLHWTVTEISDGNPN